MNDDEVARRGIACLDLTNLDEGCAPADIDALCARARTPLGPVAAVCVWPRHVAQAKALLAGGPVRVATVVNFPAGGENEAAAVAETAGAIADGADEIDLVLPYRAFAEGRADVAAMMIAAVREAAGEHTLKVILETGMLRDTGLIRRAADLAITEGADFVKTSTGKVEINATPEAARVMLDAIAASGAKVGLKPSGGVRTLDDARLYLEMADAHMGEGWAAPERFRFGASGLLTALLGAAPDMKAVY